MRNENYNSKNDTFCIYWWSCLYWCSLFLCADLNSYLVILLFRSEGFLLLFLVVHIHNWCISFLWFLNLWTSQFPPYFWRKVLFDIKVIIFSSFFLLKCIASIVSNKNPGVNLIVDLLWVMTCFFWCFQDLGH